MDDMDDWERARRNAIIARKIRAVTDKLLAEGPDACRAFLARCEKRWG